MCILLFVMVLVRRVLYSLYYWSCISFEAYVCLCVLIFFLLFRILTKYNSVICQTLFNFRFVQWFLLEGLLCEVCFRRSNCLFFLTILTYLLGVVLIDKNKIVLSFLLYTFLISTSFYYHVRKRELKDVFLCFDSKNSKQNRWQLVLYHMQYNAWRKKKGYKLVVYNKLSKTLTDRLNCELILVDISILKTLLCIGCCLEIICVLKYITL